MFSDRLFRLSRRQRISGAALVVALLLVTGLAWSTPQGQRFWEGPSAAEVALQTERARADDLKTQLTAAEEKLTGGRPPVLDTVQKARADDLKAQLDALQAELVATQQALGRAEAEAAAQADTANVVNGELKATRERHNAAAVDTTAKIADLRRQVQELSWKVENPKGYVPPPVTASMTKSQILAASQLFGLYTTQSPFDYAEFNGVEAAVNRNANVSGYFQSWDTPFRPDAVQAAWSRGQIPLLTWESQSQIGSITSDVPEFSLSRIIGGAFDDYLHQYARDITATGLPLVIRFDHEMNGSWYPWSEIRGWDGGSVNGNKPGQYVEMWRHVHDIFEAEGANDLVVWLWAPNRVNKIPSQPHPRQFYPGPEYVDWVGMSGYYRPGDPVPTFDDTYAMTLPMLREAAPGKPIFLAEIGATERGGKKAQWISNLFDGLARPENSDIIGIGWFSLAVTSGEGSGRSTNDWRLDSSPQSLRAAADGFARTGIGLPRP
ncbi:glycoside hydrolase family 26 protein [Cellulomonas algicola]|uniref:glycoside hydrolase family 26 protein n=1 Tax=Cellulomonas algicola TaxID=2071633 RepID=UPI001C3FEDC0|nr:glycosyl hydrolase [Cellulomonas algicola]